MESSTTENLSTNEQFKALREAINDIQKRFAPPDPDAVVHEHIIAKHGIRPKDIPTKTPNSVTEEAVVRLEQIQEATHEIEDPTVQSDVSFLVDLASDLIQERELVELELNKWRQRFDDLLVIQMKATMGLRMPNLRTSV